MKLTADTITYINATALLNAGLAALRAGDTVFDLAAVARCDSSAVAVLLAWRREGQVRAAQVRFTALPADLVSLATLYGVATLIR
jgi:phospholipid transport system transporter-binding protein